MFLVNGRSRRFVVGRSRTLLLGIVVDVDGTNTIVVFLDKTGRLATPRRTCRLNHVYVKTDAGVSTFVKYDLQK